MKKALAYLLLAVLTLACDRFSDPYTEQLSPVTLHPVFPQGESPASGYLVRMENISTGAVWKAESKEAAPMTVKLPGGVFRFTVRARQGAMVWNGMTDRVIVSGAPVTVEFPMQGSESSPLVVKELYIGGCSKAPEEGTWQSDQYVLLHNNASEPFYLDGLCFGTLTPYNSNAVNRWLGEDGSLPPFAPVVTVVWKFPGGGTDHPLQPGEDALVALRGAIDHTAQYPLSVNLNRADCWVCYSPTYFPNEIYHPAPGDQVRPDHYLEVAIKTGQANANVVSVTSPAFLVFRPEGMTIEEYLLDPSVVVDTPGSSVDRVVKVPYEWVLDAVEVFDGRSTSNGKRLPASLDAGFVTQSEPFKGHSLLRLVDEEATAVSGFVVLQDTNNSSEDFYERETATLHTP